MGQMPTDRADRAIFQAAAGFGPRVGRNARRQQAGGHQNGRDAFPQTHHLSYPISIAGHRDGTARPVPRTGIM
ncbi:hypothetical protein AA13595_0565 [Gluconacetobacter johannae DSM 13595]|nr:hypothetical protein AA13595_0565 [Gluconacetobacter johannae DSM 13595]